MTAGLTLEDFQTVTVELANYSRYHCAYREEDCPFSQLDCGISGSRSVLYASLTTKWIRNPWLVPYPCRTARGAPGAILACREPIG